MLKEFSNSFFIGLAFKGGVIRLILYMFLSVWPNLLFGQTDIFNNSRQRVGEGNSTAFNRNRSSNFNSYRQKLNAEYVSMTRKSWKEFNSFRALISPDKDVKPVSPIVMSDDNAKKEKEDNRIAIEGVVNPVSPVVRPQPIAPIQETVDETPNYFTFSYLNTSIQVRKPQSIPVLNGIDELSVANAWEELCTDKYNNLLIDCIKLRSSRNLCDWAYLLMLKDLGESLCGKNTNEAVLLMAYLYSQSGYRMRLGQYNGKLQMLYASQHDVYGRPYFECDGIKFFAMSKVEGTIKINAAKYPKEQSLSLWVNNAPEVDCDVSQERTLVSQRYPELSIHVGVNRNLLNFYESYPTSEVGGNFMTRWAMYANTPLCSEVREQLYSQLTRQISGMSQLDAVERLLNFVQTAFVYEYDDKVWGNDRAFFAEESLYYPYCDCEDRSILFSRLVRDLLGLKVVLVYYPGHLATAVHFTDHVTGDYILLNNQRFTVCDPTYIGAPVGATMPDMDNAGAKVILLE